MKIPGQQLRRGICERRPAMTEDPLPSDVVVTDWQATRRRAHLFVVPLGILEPVEGRHT